MPSRSRGNQFFFSDYKDVLDGKNGFILNNVTSSNKKMANQHLNDVMFNHFDDKLKIYPTENKT